MGSFSRLRGASLSSAWLTALLWRVCITPIQADAVGLDKQRNSHQPSRRTCHAGRTATSAALRHAILTDSDIAEAHRRIGDATAELANNFSRAPRSPRPRPTGYRTSHESRRDSATRT
jgi:hypothetical protein